MLIGPILNEVSLEMVHADPRQLDGLYFLDPQGLLRGIDENKRIHHEKPDGIEACFQPV